MLILKLHATRSLSAFVSSPGATHWEALGRAISYLKSMKVKDILCVEPESCKVIGLADTHFGSCIKTRRSLVCSLPTIGVFLVDWCVSKHLTLSNSNVEAECK